MTDSDAELLYDAVGVLAECGGDSAAKAVSNAIAEIAALRARVAVLERALKGLVDAAEDAACDDPDEDAILDDAYCEARRIIYYAERSPVDGKRKHVESADCWCKPTLDYRDAETGREHWVHHEPN